MISDDALAVYRQAEESAILAHMASRLYQISNLLQRIHELQDDSVIYNALLRSRNLKLNPAACPRCAIRIGKDVDLVQALPSLSKDFQEVLLECSAGCGFDHMI